MGVEVGATTFQRVAFVIEQTLGHVTHTRNLRAAVEARPDIKATWLPVPFEPGLLASIPLLGGNWSLRASWRAWRSLGEVLSTEKLDAILFHTQVTALMSVATMRRIPSVVCLDATPENFDSVGRFYGHRPASGGFLDRRKHQLNQRVVRAAAALVAWSRWTARSLVEDYGVDESKIRVLAPGAARPFFEIGERRVASETVGRSGGRVRLLFVGGDFLRKGGPLLLDAVRGHLARDCELHLVTNESIEPRANVFVHRGLAPNSPALLRLFAEADVFVLPSLGDCLPLVLMEATAAALPVVTTDIGALGETVVEGESGYLCRPGDDRGLRMALEDLVANPSRRRRLGRVGHELARRVFDAEKNNRGLLDLIGSVATMRGEVKAA